MSKQKWGEEQPVTARRGRWSAEEVARFKQLYGLKDERALAREFKRTVPAIRSLAESLYVEAPKEGPWSPEEVEQLRQYLGASSMEALCRVIGRTQTDVEAKITQLALTKRSGPWGHEEVADFKRLYGTRTDEDLAIIFERRLEDITEKAAVLCISKDKAFLRRRNGGKQSTRMPRWSSEELTQLQELYPTHSNLDIAKQLGRSVKSVVSKAHNMGLKKDPARLKQMGRENVSLRYERKRGEDSNGAEQSLEVPYEEPSELSDSQAPPQG